MSEALKPTKIPSWVAFPPRILTPFVRESNAIEGIRREPTRKEIVAHDEFLALKEITIGDLEVFVHVIAGKPLRRQLGRNVYVGDHRPPPGGPEIETKLRELLVAVQGGDYSPYTAHVAYESLHPFMDGNGRSGRVLWAWHMHNEYQDPFALPFLHRFYYQALDASSGR